MRKGVLGNSQAIIPITEMRLDYGFSGDCFPLTFELSEQVKPLIAAHLPRRRKWHFNDRVLLWLSEELEPDLINFYQGKGQIFLMKYDAAWAQKLDIALLRELVKRLAVLSPDLFSGISENPND
ncbi:hypothetical protein [Pseudomonas sp. D(2018)]|uniref:hypothetical protein n=1 Tax=Pseudomonas sp. D(2018) TaxID=2502238 RepID=UPI0010F8A5F4|nr:hypothetical protein [Pseudomonas sp. D(2018)]